MSNPAVRKRYDYLDIAKAITIFLVMIGHTTSNGSTPYFRLVLYIFHMPLFFMVSGVVVRTHQSSGYGMGHWIDFLRKNVLAIVVPYLIWALIFSHFTAENTVKIFYGSWQMLGEVETVTSLWFLTCLFCARILMELTLMSSKCFPKFNRHLYAAIMAIPAFAIGFLLPKLESGYPWCLNISFVALGFMLVGYSLKDQLAAMHTWKLWKVAGLWVISTAVFVACIVIQGQELPLVMMCSGEFHNVAWFLLEGFSGSGMILMLSVMLSILFVGHEDSKVRHAMLWIGKNTIGIFLLHKPLLQEVIVKGAVALGLPMPNVWVAAGCSAVTLVICCLAILVIDKYIPQLFGKFPNPKKIVVKEPLIPEEVDGAQEVS